MENISCTTTIDSQNQKIVLTGIQSENIHIDYSGDIDFTPIVNILAEMIDFKKNITFKYTDLSQQTEKEKLVVETLKKIIDSYNISINQESDSENLTQGFVASASDDLTF